MKLLGKVQNGNYEILMFDDGTKVRRNNLDCFIPEKPESLDYKITNKCDKGCPFCHEDSRPDGAHGDIMHDKFVETLNPFTELAIGGGNPLEHPDLIPFLKKCKKLKLIPNMTINQVHFIKHFDEVKKMVDDHLIYGLGVSLVTITDDLIAKLKQIPTAVIHMINGVHTIDDFRKLYDKGLKILILGYKEFRRGKTFYNKELEYEKERNYVFLPEIVEHFAVVSFDNLSLEQLKVKDMLSKDEWDKFYMGGDGTFTMFVDSVTKTFSVNSTTPIEERQPMLDDIKPMFDYVREHHK
jgi:MoaA/NifB/PqqE/SkfB family radical SAM enzyme